MSDTPIPDSALVARFRRDAETAAGASLADETLGVAVSGGADSLALLLLAAAAFPGRIAAATVDHGLREDAAAEAAFVTSVCERLAVPHAILTLAAHEARHLRERGDVQSNARRWRYSHLRAWCREHGIRWLLTAHHADDQLETMLMRANRGAGVGGLAGVRERLSFSRKGGEPTSCVEEPVWTIIRPVLGYGKVELERICRNAGLEPIRDPSNDDPRFDRTLARRLVAGQEWLRADRFADSAHHLGEADDALRWAAEQEKARRRIASEHQRADRFTYDLDGLPSELVRRIASDAIESIGMSLYPHRPHRPRGDELKRLIAAVGVGEPATLGHALVRRAGRFWTFTPAPPRRGN